MNFSQYIPPSLLQTAQDTFPGLTNLPLGDPADLKKYSLNLQDSIPLDDDAQVPLQFVFEPADCRIFYTADMVQEQNAVWQYAHDVAWGGKPCAWGSMGTVAPDSKNATGAEIGARRKRRIGAWTDDDWTNSIDTLSYSLREFIEDTMNIFSQFIIILVFTSVLVLI